MNIWKYRLAQLVSLTQPSRHQTGRRVLMYHSVGLEPEISKDIYSLSKQNFYKHMDLLEKLSKNSISKVVPLQSDFASGVTITFDDGYQDTWTIATEILVAKSFPFTVFVSSTNVISGNPKFLSQAQLIELSNAPGVTIGSHGHAHTHLAQLSVSEIRSDLQYSKDWLEQTIQKPVKTLSYPHGSYNQEVVQIAQEVGYQFAATSNWGNYVVGTQTLEIPRIDIWSRDSATTLGQKLNGKWDWITRFV